MTTPIPKSALQVQPEQIKHLSDVKLLGLMLKLLHTEAYRSKADISKVVVNAEVKATDAGCDAFTPAPQQQSIWLGDTETCWQFKAGRNGEPKKLEGEVTKDEPSRILRAGGRFVVITGGSVAGEPGRKARRDVLIREAKAAGLPTDKIDVYTSENLAIWCNETPSLAAEIRGMPAGLVPLDRWRTQKAHIEDWFPSDAQSGTIAQLRAALDFVSGNTTHVHIYGQPGVGKTRLALELCKAAPWDTHVLYVGQAQEVSVTALISSIASEPDTHLMLVVDEASSEHLGSFNDALSMANGRIRLVTIGHKRPHDSTRVKPIEVSPLDQATCKAFIKKWHPGMSPEQIDFAAWFSDGYVRLARLASIAIAADPTIDTRKLIEHPDVAALMGRLLGTVEDRRPLYVVALLKSIGWSGRKEVEGQAVAAHFEQKWSDVQYAVDSFHSRLGIAPRKGELRYISPEPLAIYLALEAWRTFQAKCETLPDALPSEEAKDAYYERLRALAGHSGFKKYAQGDLSRPFELSDFRDAGEVRRWEALTAADKTLGLMRLRHALTTATHDERLQLEDDARRRLVWALVHFAWNADGFVESIRSLSELAEAENERWANNATGEFVSKFQVALGGTEVPYKERLPVLESIAQKGPTYLTLVIKALAEAGDNHASRMAPRIHTDGPYSREWLPRTPADFAEHSQAGIQLLTSLVETCTNEHIEQLLKAAKGWTMLLRRADLRDSAAIFYKKVVSKFPATREAVRSTIGNTLSSERKYWKELSPSDYEFVHKLHDEFVDMSLTGRLRQLVSDTDLEDSATRFAQLATELLGQPEVLRTEWSWLCSGQGAGLWLLGQALGEADAHDALNELIKELAMGCGDTRAVAAYLSARAKVRGQEWLDEWLDQLDRDRPDQGDLVVNLTWRCTPTSRGALRIAAILRAERAGPGVSILEFGPWASEMAEQSFLELLNSMVANRRYHSTAISFLSNRLDKHKTLANQVISQSLTLISSPALIRAGHMTSYYWGKVANEVADQDPGAIAKAIFEQQADREGGTWFIQHSEAAGVLQRCAEKNPRAVWDVLKPFLSDYRAAMNFAIGFPSWIMSQLPLTEVLDWVKESPDERAVTAARLVGKDVSIDSLGGKILDMYCHIDGVGSQIMSEFISGIYHGPSSVHWESMADLLDQIGKGTPSARIKKWAEGGSRDFRRMAERDRQSEEEEELRDP